MSMAVCFSGRIGSGKTSVSRQVAKVIEGAWSGFGDFVRSQAVARSLDPGSREVLQDLGAELIRIHGSVWLCEQVIASAQWDGSKPLVIDGVRHVAVMDDITQLIAPHRAVLVHLALDDELERSRDLDAHTRVAAEKHSTEQDVIHRLPQRADLVVSSNEPIEQVVNTIVSFIRTLGASTNEV